MAKKDKGTKPNKDKKKGSAKIMAFLIISSIALVILLKTTFIFLILGMLPTIVAYYVDVSKSRNTFHTVFACNLSGVLPFVVDLFAHDNNTQSMQMFMGDLRVFFIMYLSAGFGYVLVNTSPHLAAFIINLFNQRHIARLNASQKKLLEEWGPGIRTASDE